MGLYRRRTGGAGDALNDGTFAVIPRLANTGGTDFRSGFSAAYCRVLHWLARPGGWLHAAQTPGSFRRVNRASDCRWIGRRVVRVLSSAPRAAWRFATRRQLIVRRAWFAFDYSRCLGRDCSL